MVMKMNQLSLFEDEHVTQDHQFDVPQVGPWADKLGKRLHETAKEKQRSITAISLFSGAGGLDIGFHDVGFDIQHAVEIEQSFSVSLEANVGEGKYFGAGTQVHCIDIKDFDVEGLSADFIIGGPPCQSFSAAGARAMGVAGTKDERGNLFQEYVRILKSLRPKGFLFENVYRLLGANGGKDWTRISSAFIEAGYEIYHKILDTADYGVAQHRERLIVVGVRNDIAGRIKYTFPRPTHGPDSNTGLPHFSAGAALFDIESSAVPVGLSGRYGHLLSEVPAGLNYSFFTEKMGHPNPIFAWRSKFSDFLYKADPDVPVRTIKAQGGQYTGPFHWSSRPFIEAELKRLQSFPDDYVLVGKRQKIIHQIGNSVPPQFARMLAVSVMEQIFEHKVDLSLDYSNSKQSFGFRQRSRLKTDIYRSAAAKKILESGDVQGRSIFHHEVKFSIGPSHSFTVHGAGEYCVRSQIAGEVWTVDVRKSGGPSDGKGHRIDLAPIKDWAIPASGISLNHGSSSRADFLSLWKALDFLLAFYGLKADLVQLFGYYQYPSGVSCKPIRLDFPNGDQEFSGFVHCLMDGRMIGKPHSIQDLAMESGVHPRAIPSILQSLKGLGYEVRSSNTNQALDSDHFMIPYCFPTLTPQSVQLNKGL